MLILELVAAPLLGAVFQVLLAKIASREFLAFFKKRGFDPQLRKKLEFLLLTISALLSDAEEKQPTNSSLILWLDELQDAVYEAEDVVDEISTHILRFKMEGLPQSNNTQNKKLETKIKNIVERLQFVAEQKDLLGLRKSLRRKTSSRLPTTSLVVEPVVLGRHNDKEAIFDFLLPNENRVLPDEIRVPGANEGRFRNVIDEGGIPAFSEEIPVLALVGMPGVGKTTLAQHLFNDDSVKEEFNQRMWVHVSEQLNVVEATKIVSQSVLETSEFHTADLNMLQIQIQKAVKGKKFLIVFDDVWSENFSDWSVLKGSLRYAASGSRIIVTTRSTSVASAIRATRIQHVRPLTDDDCWSLFLKYALRRGIEAEYPQIREFRGEIVKKCGGLPLVAKTLGSLLYCVEEVEEWRFVLNSEVWDLPNNKSNILPALILSYSHLPSHLKRCFAYCSMFPKGYQFVVEELVLLWMAEGLLLKSGSNNPPEDVGKDYFRELVSRSFFQQSDDKKYFKMHDLFSDLAKSVAGEFWFKCEDENSHQVPEKVRYFSFQPGKFDPYKKFDAFRKANHLRTFLPLSSPSSKGAQFLSPSALEELLKTFNHLRVLSLAHYNITKLPKSIDNLIHLRYLNLSDTGITGLPNSLCCLYNLETLLLSGCGGLTMLPKDMHNLVNLQHLDVSNTGVKEMPPEFGRLMNLHVLTDFVVGERSSSIREISKLSHLRILSVLNLENVIYTDAQATNMKEKKFLRELAFEWSRGTRGGMQKEVLNELQPHEKLKKLSITNYGGKSFPDWVGNASFSRMVTLHLSNCENCWPLPPLGQLCSLKKLHVSGMRKVTVVNSEFYGSSIEPFRCLETLEFNGMPEWSSLTVEVQLSALQNLSLINCPKLTGNLPEHLPELKTLHISECPELGLSFLREDTDRRRYKALKSLCIGSSCAHLPSFPLCYFNNLEELRIQNCSNLKGIETSVHDLTHLRKLEILDCRDLEFSPRRMRAPKLDKLLISNCKNIKSMPEELYSLTSLQNLSISKCPKLASFPEGGLPANLRALTINGCHDQLAPSVEWGLGNMKSLTSFEIEGSCIGMNSFQAEELLPNTITSIKISGLRDLKFISHMTNLTLLESLDISGCENLNCIADKQLPLSLNSLIISRCHLMTKRCQKGGEDWDKISHIPEKFID